MKILVVGSFEKIWSTNNEMVKYLIQLKHEVIKFDYRKGVLKPRSIFIFIFKIFSFSRRLPILGNLFITLYTSIFNRGAVIKKLINIIELQKPDLIYLCKVDTLNIKKLEKYKNKLLFYFMDPLFMSKKIRTDIISRYCRYSISTFGIVSEKKMNSNFNRHNIQGVDTDIFKIITPWNLRNNRIVFIANMTPKRKKLVKNLRKLGIPIDCYGNGWENKPIYYSDLNLIYNSYKYALNLCQDLFGFSVRVQQALASGTIVFSDYSEDINSFSNLFSNLYIFNDENDFHQKWKNNLNMEYKNCDFDFGWFQILRNDINWITSK